MSAETVQEGEKWALETKQSYWKGTREKPVPKGVFRSVGFGSLKQNHTQEQVDHQHPQTDTSVAVFSCGESLIMTGDSEGRPVML